MSSPDWKSPILHADLDAFYASVEELYNPELKGKAVIVGGTSSRGVVTSASYEARRFGVRSAMPTSRARRLCPHGIFVSPNFDAYIEKSKQVKGVMDSFSISVEPVSLDEAFLDVTKARRMWANPATVAEALKDKVYRSAGLVVSVGVAPNKFLAKLASRAAKPDGIVVVKADRVDEFLGPLPVGAIWGVGEKTETVLKRLGLRTIGDIAAVPRPALVSVLGSAGAMVADLSRGRDPRRVVSNAPARSVGAEETFERDLMDLREALEALLRLSDRVASRLRAYGISGRTVTLKLRLYNFDTCTRSRTAGGEMDTASALYQKARDLLPQALGIAASQRPAGIQDLGGKRIRLLGISVSNLLEWPASEQISLERSPSWAQAEETLDRVRFRFGHDALGFGSVLAWEQRKGQPPDGAYN